MSYRAPAKINERYYAIHNNPSFNQFKNKYHFVDDQDRQYMIAVKDRQLFANTRFKNTRNPRHTSTAPLEPVVDNFDVAKLYVKLTDPLSQWFKRRDMGKQLVLKERAGGKRSFVVTLKSQENAGSRTGTVYVTGLDKETLSQILNQ